MSFKEAKIAVYSWEVKEFSNKKYKAITVINHPIERVYEVIEDVENYTKFMPDYEEIDLYKKEELTVEFYAVMNPQMISRRDFILKVSDKIGYDKENSKKIKKVISCFKNIDHSKFPDDGKHIRMPYLKGYYHLESIDGDKKTRIIYSYLIDLGASFPAFIMNKVLADKAIETIKAIRERCQK